jgi:hypothetical protein
MAEAEIIELYFCCCIPLFSLARNKELDYHIQENLTWQIKWGLLDHEKKLKKGKEGKFTRINVIVDQVVRLDQNRVAQVCAILRLFFFLISRGNKPEEPPQKN